MASFAIPTPGQLKALTILADNQGHSSRELSERLGIKKGNLSRDIVTPLERRGITYTRLRPTTRPNPRHPKKKEEAIYIKHHYYSKILNSLERMRALDGEQYQRNEKIYSTAIVTFRSYLDEFKDISINEFYHPEEIGKLKKDIYDYGEWNPYRAELNKISMKIMRKFDLKEYKAWDIAAYFHPELFEAFQAWGRDYEAGRFNLLMLLY